MAGAFSGHLLHTFNNGPAQPCSPAIVTSGATSFDARAHGTPAPSSFFSPSPTPHALFGFTPLSDNSTTSKQIATLQAKLNKKLGPEYISQRPGPGGGPKLTYAEGWKIINLANEVFGFNGWSSSVVSIVTDFVDYSEESKKYNVGVTAIVRVTLRDGAYHEDVGYGMLENGKSKAAALDKCKKEAITDALKRTLRNFGNLLGNCLYDKSYAQEVVKIKVPPAKLDKNELYRRPEFEERTPDAPVLHDQEAVLETPSTRHEEPRIKVEQQGNQPETPITYVPRHLRQEIAAAAQQAQAQTPACAATPPQRAQTHTSASGSGSSTTGAPTNRGPPPAGAPKSKGLATPIQTPARAQRPPRAPPPRAPATSPLAQTASTLERNVSFAEPMPMIARAGSTGAADQTKHDTDHANGQRNDDDDDAFPLSTQDGVFFATVDLGEGDLGRPIDFDEGMGGVSMMDASEVELDSAERSPAVLPQPQPQVRSSAGSGSSAGLSSSGPSKVNLRTETQAQPAAKPPLPISANGEPNASTSGGQAQSRSGLPSTTSMLTMRTGPPAQDAKRPRPVMPSMGVHYPPGTKPPMQHIPKPVTPACVRAASSTPQPTGPTNANANVLKRSADVMQVASSSGSSTRPPIQGMGLAQRQQQYYQNAGARRPLDSSTSEGHDPKRLKR